MIFTWHYWLFCCISRFPASAPSFVASLSERMLFQHMRCGEERRFAGCSCLVSHLLAPASHYHLPFPVPFCPASAYYTRASGFDMPVTGFSFSFPQNIFRSLSCSSLIGRAYFRHDSNRCFEMTLLFKFSPALPLHATPSSSAQKPKMEFLPPMSTPEEI